MPRFDPTRPYNDLPDLPPQQEVETKAVLKACIEARAALARLDAEAAKLPNPSILIKSLTIFEAQSSSEIENIVTTDDKLFRQAQLDEASADPATKEALRYRDALYRGYERLGELPVSTRLALEICRTIKNEEIDIRRIPGTALRSSQGGKVIYTPPVGENVIRAKLANWERFIHEATHIDPLVRMAIQHYQFEAIHPFSDGNGRTGRILNILFLIEKKLLDLPILYLSREILEDRSTYYDFLLEVTINGAWETWIVWLSKCVTISALRSEHKVYTIRVLMLHTHQHVMAHRPQLGFPLLIDLLFRQPYCRIADVVNAGIAKRQTAAAYLRVLVAIGVLSEMKIGREKLFLHKKFHELLTTDGSAIRKYGPADIEGGALTGRALEPPPLLFPLTARSA